MVVTGFQCSPRDVRAYCKSPDPRVFHFHVLLVKSMGHSPKNQLAGLHCLDLDRLLYRAPPVPNKYVAAMACVFVQQNPVSWRQRFTEASDLRHIVSSCVCLHQAASVKQLEKHYVRPVVSRWGHQCRRPYSWAFYLQLVHQCSLGDSISSPPDQE